MPEILFYQLFFSSPEEALPVFLERCVARGWRVLVCTGSVERCNSLDRYLWTYRDDSFLPHGIDEEPRADEQPVLLAAGEVFLNAARVCFFLDGICCEDPGAYDRLTFLFSGHDRIQTDSVKAYWKDLKAKGYTTIFWYQNRNKKWERHE